MSNNKTTLPKQRKEVPLDEAGIDTLSHLLAGALEQAGVNRKDIIRLRLAVEEILGLWRSSAEKKTVCTFRCGTRLGRMYLEITAPGRRIDPDEATADMAGQMLCSNLLAQAGLSPVYSYQDGINRLALYLSKPQKISPLLQLLLAILSAGTAGVVLLALPAPVREAAAGVVTPLFTALMGILQTLASPMIFLSVCWGIINIGDVHMLGRIGKLVLLRFLGAIFLLTAMTAACLVWLFRPEGGAASMGENAAAQIYSMLLEIIPGNIVTPFLEGNSLQIIFMAICAGLVLLVLGEKTSALRALLGQLNTAVQFMMEVVSRYISLFVFVSLLSLMLSDAASNLGGVVKGLLLGMAACVAWPLLYALWACLRLRVSFPLVLRKLLPTYLIALSTASSSAALSSNLETCERRLGVSGRIVHFAVPLGQVMFKTGGAVGFFVLALGLAEFYGVAMPLSWIVTGVLTAGLLAIAAPPVPGGSLTCYTVLLAQLGIPDEAIGLAVAGNVILDFFMTSCGISCLQSELMLSANRLGMLDRGRLEKE
ncbi:cation:dicarboxylate symporter family transporter [Intestinimonas butyriciproducens]|uniref:cation:dicarboxylate symporter family transporter n=1 Tax=Intestinimonas butyriciproducens TaxID=1297617 RepID=UPI001958AD50|nr:cation:dicarboxylase symporter family transporter [Intestinimonas butyriciproducens]MBM6974450.1 cation:dicarboxylase symporter family transporter [Intestinimonas butyriciproducens]